MAGQPQAPNAVLSFDCKDVHVHETPTSMDPSTIVSASAPYYLSADFAFGGAVAQGLVNVLASLPGTQWRIRYSAESLGAGPEVSLGTVNGSFTSGQLAYSNPATRLTVAAGALPAGVYRLVAVITLPNLPGVTGFYEGPTIQVI